MTLGSYSPAGEIGTRTNSNDAYAWTQALNVTKGYTPNGLDQYTAIAGASLGYDARGNLTSSGGTSYAYTSENALKSVSGGTMLYYDPLQRLGEYDTSVSTRFAYDGGAISEEIANPSGAVLRRYVFGPGGDEPIVWYEGAGTGDKRWLDQDERGSITRITAQDGSTLAVNGYDEYGNPSPGNLGRFGYTGQARLPEAGLDWYKARMYAPALGRFMQTDPIGYDDGTNLYAYVHNDPVNGLDSNGLSTDCSANGYLCASTNGTTSSPSSNNSGSSNIIGAIFDLGDEIFKGIFGHHHHHHHHSPMPQNMMRRHPCSPTAAQMKNSGPVAFAGVGVSAYGGIGGSLTRGSFTTASGISGRFTAIAFGVGAGVSFQGAGGAFNNLSSFVGGNDNINVNTPVYEFSASKDLDGNYVGGSAGSSFGPNLGSIIEDAFGAAAALLSTSVSASFSDTDIHDVTCPGPG